MSRITLLETLCAFSLSSNTIALLPSTILSGVKSKLRTKILSDGLIDTFPRTSAEFTFHHHVEQILYKKAPTVTVKAGAKYFIR